MRIVLSGASGLIGAALVSSLAAAGHEAVRLVRRSPSNAASEIEWNPATGMLDAAALRGADAVIHLSGESVASGRWTAARKASILESRIASTSLLARTIAGMEDPPKTWLCASAIGIYGDCGERVVDETGTPGKGFLADVCRKWEEAARPAAEAGCRVVNLRFGVVLSEKGGALKAMVAPIRLGLGGAIGNGRQYMSWIALDDAVGAILHVLDDARIAGPVNLVSPNPATNAELTKALGRVLSRPTLFAVPAFAIRLALGEMADEMLLASTRVRPGRLIESGYRFAWPELEPMLRHALRR